MELKWTITSRILPLLLIGSMLSIVPSVFPAEVIAQEDPFPIIPDSSWVDLAYRRMHGYSYIDVAITFPDPHYYVSDWGIPTSMDSIGWQASAETWWGAVVVFIFPPPGPYTESHSYNLGRPPTGEYIFFFCAWGYPVTYINFTVSYIPGDVNKDGIVDVADLTIVSLAYGSLQGEPDYNPEADINKDGIVDMKDLSTVARHLGETDH